MTISKNELTHKLEVLDTIYEYKRSLSNFIRYNVNDDLCANTHTLVNKCLNNEDILLAEKTLERECFAMIGEGWEIVRVPNK